MPDTRFFESAQPLSLAALAELTGAVLARGSADDLIDNAAPLAQAGERGVAFLGDPKYRADLAATGASAVFLAERDIELAPPGVALLVTREAQAAWSRAARALHVPRDRGLADQRDQAAIEPGVTIAPGVVIGAGAAIGRGTRIAANAVIGPGVQIGRDCEIGPGASLSFCLLGDRVRISSSAVIGEAGFGVAGSSRGLVEIPQFGRVILQDDVSVGANTCIDRGAYDDTVIGEGTKIDNLVQIGHNTRIGRHCVLAGHVGISGSVTIGDGSQLGGKAGVTDHVRIGAGCKLAAASWAMNDIPDGEVWGGQPARPHRRFLRETMWLAKEAGKRRGTADE